MVGNPPSLLWTEIEKNPTNVEDFRRIIKRAVNERARLQAMEISKFHLTDGMLKDIIKLDLAPGGGLPVFYDLATRNDCAEHLTHIGAVSEQDPVNVEKYRETRNTRTYNEAEKGIKKDPRKSAGT